MKLAIVAHGGYLILIVPYFAALVAGSVFSGIVLKDARGENRSSTPGPSHHTSVPPNARSITTTPLLGSIDGTAFPVPDAPVPRQRFGNTRHLRAVFPRSPEERPHLADR